MNLINPIHTIKKKALKSAFFYEQIHPREL